MHHDHHSSKLKHEDHLLPHALSFNLIFEEIRSCGFYSNLDIIECSEQGLEFFVEIQKNTVKNESSERIGKSRRIDLLKKSLGFMLDDLNNQSA